MKKFLLFAMMLVGLTAGAANYAITFDTFVNGNVTADKTVATYIDEKVTLTVTPDAGYKLSTIAVTARQEVQGGGGGARAPRKATYINQGAVEVIKDNDNTYHFMIPELVKNAMGEDVEPDDKTQFYVTATFEVLYYPIVFAIDEDDPYGYGHNGTVVATPAQATIGETVTLKITPNDGYLLESMEHNGVQVIALDNRGNDYFYNEGDVAVTQVDENTFTFVIPETVYIEGSQTGAPHAGTEFHVRAYFIYDEAIEVEHKIVVVDALNGYAASDKATAYINEAVNITVYPDNGYELDALTVEARYKYEEDPYNNPGAFVYVIQGSVPPTKVDDAHYTFIIPRKITTATGEEQDLYFDAEFLVTPSFKAKLPSGIETINVDTAKTGQRYNVLGQPVDANYKGLVIVDGKKILVK